MILAEGGEVEGQSADWTDKDSGDRYLRSLKRDDRMRKQSKDVANFNQRRGVAQRRIQFNKRTCRTTKFFPTIAPLMTRVAPGPAGITGKVAA